MKLKFEIKRYWIRIAFLNISPERTDIYFYLDAGCGELANWLCIFLHIDAFRLKIEKNYKSPGFTIPWYEL